MTKRRLTLRRTLSLLLALVLLIGVLPQLTPPVYAGNSYFYTSSDGIDFEVTYEDEHGVGEVVVTCPTCGETYDQSFDNNDAHDAAVDIIIDNFNDCRKHCNNCEDEHHCYYCHECFDNGPIEECPYCDTLLCLMCHEDDYFCDLCGNCRIEDDSGYLSGACVHMPNLNPLCQDCFDSAIECSGCSNVVSFNYEYFTYDEMGVEWCDNCMLCHECYENGTSVDFGHCSWCNVCGWEEPVCESCQMCWECNYGETHCTECDDCFPGGVEWCRDEGEHCVHCCEANGWLCEQCGVCLEATGGEFCEECGVCLDCCEENSADLGCVHLYCVMSADFEDHLCPDCGECPADLECEYCGLCDDCQQDYHCEHGLCPDGPDWDEHLCEGCGNCYELDEFCEYCRLCPDCQEHCDHDLCPEDPEYDDHFCSQCGDCYDSMEFCDECGLCEYCCESNTEDLGCSHGICVESDEFQTHYCFADGQCLSLCHHTACLHGDTEPDWSKNESSHWRICNDCGASVECAAHTAGSPVVTIQPDNMAGKNGTAEIRCTVCEQLMGTVSIPCIEIPKDGSPYIISEPKDYCGKFSTDQLKPEGGEARWAVMKVYAGGEGTLSYQWYDKNGKALQENSDLYIGTKTAALRAYVDESACHYIDSYYCVVTNAKGSVKTRTAEVRSPHEYGCWESCGKDGHINTCWGWGCEETQGTVKPHNYGEWKVISAPTATSTGKQQRMCTVCYYTQEEVLPTVDPAHVHNYNILKYTSERHWYACSCGLVKDEAPHSFGAWEHIAVQTAQAEGLDQRTCTVCGYTESKILAKLTHEHDFSKLKDKNVGGYDWPNGCIEDDYHVRYCYRCTAKMREAHEYGNWHVFCYPYTDKHGAYHKGRIIRKCLDCGHSESVEFTDGKWPIFTSCIDPDTEGGRWAGPYDVGGTMIANPGEKVKVTIKAHEGYLFPDSIPLGVGPFGVHDVGPYDSFWVAGEYCDPANSQVKDWKYDAATQTLTFTMPDGPVGLMLFPEKCDHEGAETYNDWIRAGCTNNGEYVRRCKRCDGVKEIISYTAPTGHSWERLWEADPGDCYNRSTYWAQCRICGEERLMRGDYHHKEGYYQDAVEPTCVKPGRTNTTVCPECLKSWRGDSIPALGHQWTAWQKVQEATPTQKERQSRSCTRCGRTETRTGDYSGPDYRFRADKTKIHFDFTYGETPAPVTVNYTSIGRNPVTEITSVGEVIGAVTKQEIDGLQMTVIPQPWILVQDWLDAEPEVLTACANNNWDEVAGSSVMVTANVRKTKENYTLTVEGGTAWIDGKDKRTAKDSLSIPGGEKLHLVADDPMGTFVRWEIVEDASGYLKEIFEHYSNYSSPIRYKNKETTVWMSANDVTLRALYEESPGLCRLTLDYNGEGTKPAEWFTGSGGTVDFLPKAANYGYIFEGWWTAPEGGEHIDVGSMLTGDTTLYAHWRSKTEPAFPDLAYSADSTFQTRTAVTVDIDAMTAGNDELRRAVQANAVQYLWYHNGALIPGENGRSFEIPDEYLGHSVQTAVCFNGHRIMGKSFTVGFLPYGEDLGSYLFSSLHILDPNMGGEYTTLYWTALALDPELLDGKTESRIDLDGDGSPDLKIFRKSFHYYLILDPDSNLMGRRAFKVPESVRTFLRNKGTDYYSSIDFKFPSFTDCGTYVFPLYKGTVRMDKDAIYFTMDAIESHNLVSKTGSRYDFDGDGVWDMEETRGDSNTYYYSMNPDNHTIENGKGYYEVILPQEIRQEMLDKGYQYYSTVRWIFSEKCMDQGVSRVDLSSGQFALPTNSLENKAIHTTLGYLYTYDGGIPKLIDHGIPGHSNYWESWSVEAPHDQTDFTILDDQNGATGYWKEDTPVKGVVCYRVDTADPNLYAKISNAGGDVFCSTLYLKFSDLGVGSHRFDLEAGAKLTANTPEARTLEALVENTGIGFQILTTQTETIRQYDLDSDGKYDLNVYDADGRMEAIPDTRITDDYVVTVTEDVSEYCFYTVDQPFFNQEYCTELVFHFPGLNKGSYTLDLTSDDLVQDNDDYLKQTLSKLIAPNADWSGPVSVDLDGDGAADIGVTGSGSDTLYTALPSTNLTGKWTWTAPEKIAQKAKSIADLTGYYDSITFVFTKTAQFLFDDVKDPAKFYYAPVYWAYEANPQITNGTDATHFGPDNACTRGQVVTFLWRAAGCPEPTSTKTGFTDVKPGAFYEKAVAWAVESQITNGMSPTSFAPNNTCTRGQIVTFLWRFKGKPEPAGGENPFADVTDGAFYYKAVLWAVEAKVTNGMSPTSFAPNSTCTRGQVVTFLYRAVGS